MGGIEINGRFLRNVQQLLKLIHPQPQTLNQVQTKSPSNDILKGGKNNALSSISSSFCSKLAGNSITCAALGLASLLGGLGWKWLRFLGFFFLYQKKPLNKTTNWSGGIFFCITCLSACICCRGSDEFPRKREKYLAHLHKEFLSDQLVCHVDHCVGHGGGEQQNAAPWVSCGGPEGATKCQVHTGAWQVDHAGRERGRGWWAHCTAAGWWEGARPDSSAGWRLPHPQRRSWAPRITRLGNEKAVAAKLERFTKVGRAKLNMGVSANWTRKTDWQIYHIFNQNGWQLTDWVELEHKKMALGIELNLKVWNHLAGVEDSWGHLWDS